MLILIVDIDKLVENPSKHYRIVRFYVHLFLQVSHVEHNTSVCLGGLFLDLNMAGRSEDESVSNSSGESR